jgi:hypothetical protein
MSAANERFDLDPMIMVDDTSASEMGAPPQAHP